jgi:cytochrome b6-f complex iron-sulfur subunit
LEVKDRTVLALEELERITRRQMCTNAATGLVALALPSCTGFVIKDGSVKGRPADEIGPPGGTGTAPMPGGAGGGDPGNPGPGGTGAGGAAGGPEPVGEPPPGGTGGSETGGTGGVVPRDAGGGRANDAGRTGAGRPDARPTPDPGPPPDAAPASACAPGLNTNMSPADFDMGTATFFSSRRVFVCRDGGGLYALSSVCTHAGCNIRFANQNSGFRCPCHGSEFEFGGDVQRGPANNPLRHFEICVADGRVFINTDRTVNRSTRFNA